MSYKETLMGLSEIVNTDELRNLPIELVFPSESQQRKHFAEAKIDQLTISIKQMGIRVPLEVKEIVPDKHYEIISGERRYRAAKSASLDIIPVIVRKKVDNIVAIESQFAENLHREDLNAVEKALAITQLMKIEGYNQKKISEICGKSKAWVSKQLRILDQPEEIQNLAKEGLIRDLNTLYEIASLPDKERKVVIKLIRAGNFDYKSYKNKTEANEQDNDNDNDDDGSVIGKKKNNEFSVGKDQLKKIIKHLTHHPTIKKEYPHWESKNTDFNKIFKEFKKWITE